MREACRQRKNDAGKYADSGNSECGKHADSEKQQNISVYRTSGKTVPEIYEIKNRFKKEYKKYGQKKKQIIHRIMGTFHTGGPAGRMRAQHRKRYGQLRGCRQCAKYEKRGSWEQTAERNAGKAAQSG